jgi:hypothetical protein
MRKVAVKRDKREFNVHGKSTMDFELKTKRDRDDQRGTTTSHEPSCRRQSS